MRIPVDKKIKILAPIRQQSGDDIADGSNPSKGILETRRPDDFLPRRLKKGGFINFFDLDLKFNLETENFDHTPYSKQPDPVAGGFQNSSLTQLLTGSDRFYEADFTTRDDLFFDVAFENWKDRYFRFDTYFGVQYGLFLEFDGDVDPIFINESESRFTSEGLKLEDRHLNAQAFNIRNAQEYHQEHTLFSSNIRLKAYTLGENTIKRNHITLTRNYADADTNFTVSRDMRIYLVPSIILFVGQKERMIGAETEETLFNYVYQSMNRETTIIPSSPYYHAELDLQQLSASPEQLNLALDFQCFRVNSRAFKRTKPPSNPNFTPIPNIDKETAFEFDPATNFNTRADYDTRWNGGAFTDNEGKPYLVAMVEKGGVWYYVWSHEQNQELP